MPSFLPIKSHSRKFHRVGGWLPDDPKVLIDWVRQFVTEVGRRRESPVWTTPIQELSDLIESTAELRMLASAMFDEVPDKPPYNKDPASNKQIRDYKHMLDLFAVIITQFAPKWSKTEYGIGFIGFPFNAILDWSMATQSGYAFFLMPEVNRKFKAILNAWRDDVLMTKKSQYVITTGEEGWLSKDALMAIEEDTNIRGQPALPFNQLFKCDPIGDPEHWGFGSWDEFFVRGFSDIDTLRPVACKNNPRWIVNSCESKPFALQTNVKEYDSFWLKGQPYLVVEMLNNLPEASNFVGGSVYQAFLSPTSYHRWNSPVQGRIVHASVVEGTYFSEPTITGFTNPRGPDLAALDQAQGYITHVVTRAIFLIETGDLVGLVGAIYVGMADLGMFHHGGSTHCLLFRKGLELKWVDTADPNTAKRNIPIRSELAYVCT
ncbi:Phophatidylserine decarboxylase-domain-containing protein [Biscogniauxia marginata]|nr:Phophatidylserine decarboxylase-domain-containing protein [Biscogniauxia marginata]